MRRLIWRLLGWGIFVYDRVTVLQKNCLVDQTLIIDALESTKSKRKWCLDKDLSIFIEPVPFKGVYGLKQTVEVARFSESVFRPRSANIRICASKLKRRVLVELISELNRDSSK